MPDTEEKIEFYAEADEGYKIEDAVISLVLTDSADLTDRFALGGGLKTYENWDADLNLGNFGSGSESKTFWVKSRPQPDDDTVECDDATGLEVKGVAS